MNRRPLDVKGGVIDRSIAKTHEEPRVGVPPSVAAVIITRNRLPMLRQTLNSIKHSSYPIAELIVSDDSPDDQTAAMLSVEFPDVIRVEGPQRGIAANRNRGMSAAHSDYILLSDDDMIVDPEFVRLALQEVSISKAGLIFTGLDDNGRLVYPNTFDLLGFSSKPYKPGAAYNTANQQCFILSRNVGRKVPYDETIKTYGYEEMDFAYRVAAAGFTIACVPLCRNIHLAPDAGLPRHEKDASRLYVTYKRLAYIDKNPVKALLFLGVAIPHHIVTCMRRFGLKGLAQALVHFRLAAEMLFEFRRQTYKRMVATT